MIIRGNENENAYCCSKSKTFSFKVAEISNPLFVTSSIEIFNDKTEIDTTVDRELKSCQVFKIFLHSETIFQIRTKIKKIIFKIKFMTSMYFEMSATKPKLEKLKYLLELNLYCGRNEDDEDEEGGNSTKKYTIEDFLDIIQASEDEIYKYLNYIEAFNVNGKTYYSEIEIFLISF